MVRISRSIYGHSSVSPSRRTNSSKELLPIKRFAADGKCVVLRGFIGLEGTKFQYPHGVADPLLVEPESYWLDTALLQRPGNTENQLDLFLDYADNVKLYPTFQEYFRKYQPPLLATWSRNDPLFIPAGAEAYRRDIPSAKVVFYDTGHFALEPMWRKSPIKSARS